MLILSALGAFGSPFDVEMHERNPYARPPDFARLCAAHADLRPHCKLVANGKVHLDFADDAAVRALTRALLKQDFALDVDLPSGSLCPRVPQRLNYLLWIEDVIVASGLDADAVRGIDIGTGASCIYALLGARRFGWSFTATEAELSSSEVARQNVARNGLSERVDVVKTTVDGAIIEDVIASSPHPHYTFCMCNPPFFDGDGETGERFVERGEEGKEVGGRKEWENAVVGGKRPAPRSGTVAGENELATEGGECAFVGRMFEESARMRDGVRFYTTMLGKKSSVAVLMGRLARMREEEDEGKEGKRLRFASGELRQGRTQRWLLAWTWDARVRLPLRPASLELVMRECARTEAMQWIRTQLLSLHVAIERDDNDEEVEGGRMECRVATPSWLRRGRKRKKTLATGAKAHCVAAPGPCEAAPPTPDPAPFLPLDFSVSCRQRATYTLSGQARRLSIDESPGADSTTVVVFTVGDGQRKRDLAQLVVHLSNRRSVGK
ncbi:mett-10 [Pristionchus pacificus]|uniref:U6 small nuclear RNA (adenine-(43)-N(6))-methyltransferase n=1 Tax=Pristionchus pacificus TaxID=54126 RepID=A0A2A6CIQ0_PRIPA|nr:mett-10 [Pristionchus pacificus]|eukprot:PDM77933.1 mett-10 [Pristionchus pacificus]